MRTGWAMAVLLLLGGACTSKPNLDRTGRTPDGGAPVDAGVDAGLTDAGADDAGPVGAGPADAGPADASLTDGGRVDAGPTDGGRVDAGVPDAGAPDGGASVDAGWSGVWEPIGPPLGHDAQVYPAMAVDSSGALLAAYADLVEVLGITTTEIRVMGWLAGGWVPVGGPIARSDMRFPYSAPLWIRLATDAAGRPVIAFGDSGPGSTSGAFPAQTWVFDGTAWQSVPVPGSAQQLGGLALGRGVDGRIRLALSTGRELVLYTMDSSGWTADEPVLSIDGGISEPDLASGGDGSTLLAFSEAPAPGSFGALRAWRHGDGAWVDLGLPSPTGTGLIFHTPRVRGRSDGGVVVAASEWQYDVIGKTQVGIGVPVFDLGEGGWALLEDDGVPGGFGLSEPIPGSPVGLQLAGDDPVVLSTASDGGIILRVFPPSGAARTAPVLGDLGAGTLLLNADGTPLVGAVMPLEHEPGPQKDGGQVRFLHFTGTPGSATPSSVP